MQGQYSGQSQTPVQAQDPARGRYPAGSSAGATGADPGYVYIIPENRAANAGVLPPNGSAPPPGATQW
jgi:hypothetical protein